MSPLRPGLRLVLRSLKGSGPESLSFTSPLKATRVPRG